MKKLVVLHRTDSFDDLQVLEFFQSMLVDVKVIPVKISHPYKCVMRNLLKFCYDNKPDVIVGLSDCALFAQQLHGYKKVLVNPVLHADWRMATIENMQFGGTTNFDKEHSYIFFVDDDAQANSYNEYSESYKNVVKFPKGHGMQDLLETYIRPIVRKLLDEEPDKKNIDAVRTYELLAEISCGGRIGRAALLNLEDALDNILAEVATTFYSSYRDVKDIASEGFRKATRDFVFEHEEMPYTNYTKYLYERLYEYFEEDASLFLITNSSSVGGFRDITPYADVSDGKLDLFIIKKCNVAELLNLLKDYRFQIHTKNPMIRYCQASHIKIECDQDIVYDIDGEKGEGFPIEVNCLAGLIDLIVPEK